MQNFETALRLIVIGQDILIAAIFLYGKGRMGLRASAALLLLSSACYLVASDQVLWDAMGMIAPLVALPAMSTVRQNQTETVNDRGLVISATTPALT